MTPEQFQHTLDRLGCALDGWPDAERIPAQALLDASPEARRHLDQARMVQRIMTAHDPARSISGDALQRVQAAVMLRLPPQNIRLQPPSAAPHAAPYPVNGWIGKIRRNLAQALHMNPTTLIWAPRLAMSVALAAGLGVMVGDLVPETTAHLAPLQMLTSTTSPLPMDM